MTPRALGLLVLVAAAGLASAGAVPARAEDDDVAALAAALKDVNFTLQDALRAGEREGQPISAQFEIDDGKLQVSVYTTKGDEFSEVVADPKTGTIVRSEKLTDDDEISDAADQKAAIEKAKVSLLAAADTAVKDNAGARAVAIFPDLRDGHAIAEVTLLEGTTAKKVTEKLD
jgi:uncharacterized lipoprotein NlpE involved in copper resistance